MAFFKSKKTAIAVCILLVLIAVVFGSHRSLNALRAEAVALYTNGDENGLSILANLNSIQAYAAALLKAAAPYYDGTDTAFAAVKAAIALVLGIVVVFELPHKWFRLASKRQP